MKLFLALDNVRSAHNVGSILRSASGFDIQGVVSIGISPHMRVTEDSRLPHVVDKDERRICKTALGGETLMLNHFDTGDEFLNWAEANDLSVASLEINPGAIPISKCTRPEKMVLVVGHEIDGVSKQLLTASEQVIYIPMPGVKESFNVASAAAIAMYVMSQNLLN